MGTGKLPDATLEVMVNAAAGVPGDFAEIGVFKGDLFWRLAMKAYFRGVRAHAFDSFQGMAEPGEKDGGKYRKGAFDVGGVEAFLKSAPSFMPSLSTSEALTNYVLWPGFIPTCFEDFERDNGYNYSLSLVYIDVDHYEPTVEATKFAWRHLSPGGVIAFDDYFPGKPILASAAIDDFIETHHVDLLHQTNNQVVFRRVD